MRSPSNSSKMTNLSSPTLRSRIKAFQEVAGTIGTVSFWFLMILSILCGVLLYLHAVLWIGAPSKVICQNVSSIRIDCTLEYQALLRSSKQQIVDVQRMDIDLRTSSSDSGSTTKYIVLLRTQDGDRPIKTYSNRNDPELEVLSHRLNKFLENPEEKLIVPIRHNPWKLIIEQCSLLFTPLFLYLGTLFVIVCI